MRIRVLGCSGGIGAGARTSALLVDNDVILVWGEETRVITGSDLLGHLLSGITKVEKPV